MAIKLNCGCIKMALPNGCVVDILTPVLDEITKWLQVDEDAPESGGYIVGYEHKDTGNIVLEKVSVPHLLDHRTRTRFDMRDISHKMFLLKEKHHKSFYMGVWHTHPQSTPTPSPIDWDDWINTLRVDKTACDFMFFIIAGTHGTRVWVGNKNNNTIVEIEEVEKVDGLYIKEALDTEFLQRKD